MPVLVAVLALAATTAWATPPGAGPITPALATPAPATPAPATPAAAGHGRPGGTPDAPGEPQGAQLPEAVRLILQQPAPTPFSVVRYEVVRRGRATAAIQRRQIEGYGEPLHAMALLTRPEQARLAAALEGNDAARLGDAAAPPWAPPGALSWRVELDLPRGTHAFRVTAPEAQPDRRYARVVRAIREAVRAHTGPLPFRNVFFPASRRGWLDVQSIPPARLEVDGVDTHLETPIYGYEVPAGRHRLRLVSTEPPLDRTYRVTVQRGGTTQLSVDLR